MKDPADLFQEVFSHHQVNISPAGSGFIRGSLFTCGFKRPADAFRQAPPPRNSRGPTSSIIRFLKAENGFLNILVSRLVGSFVGAKEWSKSKGVKTISRIAISKQFCRRSWKLFRDVFNYLLKAYRTGIPERKRRLFSGFGDVIRVHGGSHYNRQTAEANPTADRDETSRRMVLLLNEHPRQEARAKRYIHDLCGTHPLHVGQDSHTRGIEGERTAHESLQFQKEL